MSNNPDVIIDDHEHPMGTAHEKRLLNDLKRAIGNTRGRHAVRVHLSRLEPDSRQDHAMRAVESTFQTVVTKFGARFYWLREHDFVVLFNTMASDAVRSALVKVRFLFASDPLIDETQDSSETDDAFASWFRLDSDYERIMAMAKSLITEHRTPTVAQKRKKISGPASKARRGATLTAPMLAKVEGALLGADLSAYIRRQPVCAVVGRSFPDPLFVEVFVSIADLRDAMLPHVEMASNPWLFQHLTQTLDRRVLAMLNRRDDRTLTEGFSINLNVQTILSEDFLKFDDSLAPGSHGTIVLELRTEDIFADLTAYFFARDFAHQRGYRICIDGLTWQTLPYVNIQRLGADLAKLNWTDDLKAILSSQEGAKARDAITHTAAGRLIMARCDTESAIFYGQELGITLFQGRHLDKVLKPLSV